MSRRDRSNDGLTPEAVERILASRDRLTRMLIAWTGDPEGAEDILQAAYARAWDRSETVRTEDNIVAWFTELVRNLAIDRARRKTVERRVVAALSRETPESVEFSADVDRSVCECVNALLDTLRPPYREVLRKVEIEESSIGEAARALGLSHGNARVRLFRARQALRKRLIEFCGACAEHGCLDCWCRKQRRKAVKL